MRRIATTLAALLTAGALSATPANAAVWTLYNAQPDIGLPGPYQFWSYGFAVQIDGGFTLVGDNSPYATNYDKLTTLTTVIENGGVLSFDWTSYTAEPLSFNALYDPAGYMLNGFYTILPTAITITTDPNTRIQTGHVDIALNAGDVFGFFVKSRDGHGAGYMSFSLTGSPDPHEGAFGLPYVSPWPQGPGVVTGFNTTYDDGRGDLMAVPEPDTWAMLILGFGAVGAVMRRRRARGAIALA